MKISDRIYKRAVSPEGGGGNLLAKSLERLARPDNIYTSDFRIQCSQISEIALLFGRLPGFGRLSVCLVQQHVDNDKCGALLA